MVLCEIEDKILLAVYIMNINRGKKVELSDFELTETEPQQKAKEFYSYCKNIEIAGYIETKGAFAIGGDTVIAWPESLKITNPGTVYVERKILV